MTTYFEYTGVDAELDPALTVNGYRATFYWVDPTVAGIFNVSGGKATSINFSVAGGHYVAQAVNFEEDSHEDAVTAALAHANTVGPPNAGWILGRLAVGSPLLDAGVNISVVP